MTTRRIDLATMRRATRRADDGMLCGLLLLFQATAMLLLTFRTNPIDQQALILAGAMPAVTLLVMKGIPKIWRVDKVILAMVLFLGSVSVVTLTAIARSSETPLTQAIYIVAGLIVMMAAIIFVRKIKNWQGWTIPLMALSLAVIALPLIIGDWKNGAKNWIEISQGGRTLISVQPSEFVKVSLMVVLAGCLSARQSRIRKLTAVAFGAILCGVLLLERDLGALLLYFFTTIILYFLATSNVLITFAGLGAGAAGAVGASGMFDYVKKRVAIWQNPWMDPEVSG